MGLLLGQKQYFSVLKAKSMPIRAFLYLERLTTTRGIDRFWRKRYQKNALFSEQQCFNSSKIFHLT